MDREIVAALLSVEWLPKPIRDQSPAQSEMPEDNESKMLKSASGSWDRNLVKICGLDAQVAGNGKATWKARRTSTARHRSSRYPTGSLVSARASVYVRTPVDDPVLYLRPRPLLPSTLLPFPPPSHRRNAIVVSLGPRLGVVTSTDMYAASIAASVCRPNRSFRLPKKPALAIRPRCTLPHRRLPTDHTVEISRSQLSVRRAFLAPSDLIARSTDSARPRGISTPHQENLTLLGSAP
ncbi:hypothetical protein C8R45DRAFT_946534 [Mycena sanguinolenta]|nr:hypothetical protein C8R45DRAFT_946534 [Mycena sanguinolenta]